MVVDPSHLLVRARLTATAVRHEDLMVLELQATPDDLHAVDDIEVPDFKQLFDSGAAYPKLCRASSRQASAGARGSARWPPRVLHRQPRDDRATGPADSFLRNYKEKAFE